MVVTSKLGKKKYKLGFHVGGTNVRTEKMIIIFFSYCNIHSNYNKKRQIPGHKSPTEQVFNKDT